MNKWTDDATNVAIAIADVSYTYLVGATIRKPLATDLVTFGTKTGAVTKLIPVLNHTKTDKT